MKKFSFPQSEFLRLRPLQEALHSYWKPGHNLQPLEGKQQWHETYICAQLSWISNAIQACQPTGNYGSSLLPGT